MNFKKYEEMYKLLSQNKLKITKSLADELKCSKCKTVLINPCQVCCGCRYCRHCIDEMIQNGDGFCIGNSDNCKNELLLNCTVDYRANKDISMILVSCPKENCSFESELINMEEHSRCCWKDSKYLSSSSNCDDLDMADKMVDDQSRSIQFQQDQTIGNVNESVQLNFASNELRLLKLKSENLKMAINEINNELEQLTTEIKTAKSGITCEIKRENKMSGDCSSGDDIIAPNSTIKEMDVFKNEIQNLELQNERIKKYLKIEISDSFLWKIGPTKEISTNRWIGSKFFYISVNSYKLRLWMWSDLWKLLIYVYVYPSANDEDMIWPFSRNITVKIFDLDHSAKHLLITKSCRISRPAKNSTETSESFSFYHSKLDKEDISLANSAVRISFSTD